MNKRVVAIDNIKGVLTLLVILGHVTVGLEGALDGNFLSASLCDKITAFIYAFHMPVFMALSGYFWRQKQVTMKERKQIISKKFINLGLSYFLCSIAFWGIRYMMGSLTVVDMDIMDLILIPVFPIEFFWYLYSLCTISIFAEIFDALHIDKRILLIIFMVLAVGNFVNIELFGIAQTLRHAVYFYIGSFLYEQKDFLMKRSTVVVTGLTSCIFMIIYLFVYNTNNSIVRFVLCVLMCCFLIGISYLLLNKEIKYITYIGEYSMPFYVMHVIFVGGVRIILRKVGIDDVGIHIILGFVLPTVVCYVLYRYVISKNKYLDFMFYPGKYMK